MKTASKRLSRSVLTITLKSTVWLLSAFVRLGYAPTLNASEAFASQNTTDTFLPIAENVVYARLGSKDLTLDVYMPSVVAGAAPIVMWLHGGTWTTGSKSGIGAESAISLTKSGYAVVCVNYAVPLKYPAQLHACKAAVRWIRANAHLYGMNPAYIGVWGEGAGAHLAALLGTTGNEKTVELNDETVKLEGSTGGNKKYSSRVQAVVSLYGLSDFLQLEPHEAAVVESRLLGYTIAENTTKARLASPVTFVSPDDPPFFIQHGADDTAYSPAQSSALYEALVSKGVRAELDIVEKYFHADNRFFASANVARVRAFFDRWLHPVKTNFVVENNMASTK